MSLDNLKHGAISLVMIALLIAVGAIAMTEFGDDIGTNDCAGRDDGYTRYNTTTRQCIAAANATHVSVAGYTWNTSIEGLEGAQNASEYLSTIGTLLGVAALVGVVVGAFYFVMKK